MITEVREQNSKAPFSTEVTLSGIVTEVEAQSEKA
jgi:hypothetical protein